MPKGKLDLRDWIDHVPEVAGKTVNIYHCKKGKGNDRLYITRNTDGTAVAYCHHCDQSGWVSASVLDGAGIKSKPARRDETDSKSGGRPIEFADVDGDPVNWSTAARGWFCGTGLLPYNVRTPQWSTGYCGKTGRLYFFLRKYDATTITGFSSDYIKCWSRDPKGKDPKWLKEWGDSGPTYLVSPGQSTEHPKLVVIVEDLISGMRVIQDNGEQTVAMVLHGARVPKEEHFLEAMSLTNPKLDNCIITWLDNDNPDVVAIASKTKKESSKHSNLTGIVTAVCEPKHIYPARVRDLILRRTAR